jgi:catechol 2,3-dioxygenase-like lactoylglutathione lyase family enzyme
VSAVSTTLEWPSWSAMTPGSGGRSGTLLADGYFRATWRITRHGHSAILHIEPFGPLPGQDSIAAEGLRLLAQPPTPPPNVTRGTIGIRFTSNDVEAAHAAPQAAGVDADEILRWPGVPAMFAWRDPDGNVFSVTETA